MFAFRGRNRREVDRNADGAGLLRIKDHTGTVHAPAGTALARRVPERRRRAADRERSAATPENIMKLGTGFWASKTLLSATELGVFSTLAGAPADLPTLQKKLRLHQRSARDFLDALVALRMLERENGLYRNTADTDFFNNRAKPSYIFRAPALRLSAALQPRFDRRQEPPTVGRPWRHLTHAQ